MATYTSNYGWTKPSGNDNVDISVLNNNLDDQDSTIHDAFLNMASPFSESSTYAVDDIVLYGTGLYKCHTAVVTPGSWTGSTNWQVHKLSEGGGGTTDYDNLTNHPSINDVELSGNKTASELGLQDELTFDNVPTDGSNNPVKSGGVYSADEAIRQWTTAEAKSVSGNPITLTDGSARKAEGLVVTLEPKQSGSGTPSPTNVRPITGLTECVVDVKDEDETTQDTATITFGQTVYGGSVDFKTGKVTVTHKCVNLGDYAWNKLNDNFYTNVIDDFSLDNNTPIHYNRTYISSQYAPQYGSSDINVDGCIYLFENDNYATNKYRVFIRDLSKASLTAVQFKTAMDGVQLCYELATPTELTLTPAELELLKGYNYISTNGTTIALDYLPNSLLAEAENYVDAKIPPVPSSDGTYVLTCTVASGTPAYSWESAT